MYVVRLVSKLSSLPLKIMAKTAKRFFLKMHINVVGAYNFPCTTFLSKCYNMLNALVVCVCVRAVNVINLLYCSYCTCFCICLCHSDVSAHSPTTDINPFSSRQEGGELADDVISLPHSGHQLPVPALPVGRA